MTKKSKLLVRGDYPLIASPTLAQAYGVPSAMFLQKLHYCLQSSDAKCIQQQKYFYHSWFPQRVAWDRQPLDIGWLHLNINE